MSEVTALENASKTRLEIAAWWFRRLRKSATATTGAILLVALVFIAAFSPQVAPHNPTDTDLAKRFVPPAWSEGGRSEHLLGTDQLGRDLLSRIIFGSRVSLIIGLSAVVIAAAIGVTLGLIAGYVGGIYDSVIMRVVDTIIAIPKVMLYLAVFAAFGSSLAVMIGVLGALRWTTYARVVRGEVLSVRTREYVEAARALGQNQFIILFRHILPNVLASVIVIATLEVASIIIVESGMSFLGLGVQPPTVTWGRMLADGRQYVASAWWIATFPGLAITLSVLGIIFLGDWLRDVFDPKLR